MLLVEGETICEAWEKALLECYENGRTVKTQYDVDPNTGVVHPPSCDCMMTMVVKQPLAEPRCHICIPGGPAELGAYSAEVVDGSKDHWVKRRPDDKTWSYTYSGRLRRYGDRLNAGAPSAMFDIPELVDAQDNPWVGIALTRDAMDGEGNQAQVHLGVEPIDQIQEIINAIAETPFTRRAVAITSFPPIDLQLDDPPCLRYIWCRGFHEGPHGELVIEMHTHWRSRDAYKAAFMNIFALTDLMKEIIDGVQAELNNRTKKLTQGPCPVCLSKDTLQGDGEDAQGIRCTECKATPYHVLPGSYTDTSDSFHIYGKDLDEFKTKFITATENRKEKDRWWDLEAMGLKPMVAQGAIKESAKIKRRDKRDNIPENTKASDADAFNVPITIHFKEKGE